jgi:hypothetical protein
MKLAYGRRGEGLAEAEDSYELRKAMQQTYSFPIFQLSEFKL